MKLPIHSMAAVILTINAAMPVAAAQAGTLSGYMACANALRAAQGEPRRDFVALPGTAPGGVRVLYFFTSEGAFYAPVGLDPACARNYEDADEAAHKSAKVQVTCKGRLSLPVDGDKETKVYFVNQVHGEVKALYGGAHTDLTWVDSAPRIVPAVPTSDPQPKTITEAAQDGVTFRTLDQIDRSTYTQFPATDMTSGYTRSLLDDRLIEIMNGLTQRLAEDATHSKLNPWQLSYEKQHYKDAFESCKASIGEAGVVFLPKYAGTYESLRNVPLPVTVGIPSDEDEAFRKSYKAGGAL